MLSAWSRIFRRAAYFRSAKGTSKVQPRYNESVYEDDRAEPLQLPLPVVLSKGRQAHDFIRRLSIPRLRR